VTSWLAVDEVGKIAGAERGNVSAQLGPADDRAPDREERRTLHGSIHTEASRDGIQKPAEEDTDRTAGSTRRRLQSIDVALQLTSSGAARIDFEAWDRERRRQTGRVRSGEEGKQVAAEEIAIEGREYARPRVGQLEWIWGGAFVPRQSDRSAATRPRQPISPAGALPHVTREFAGPKDRYVQLAALERNLFIGNIVIETESKRVWPRSGRRHAWVPEVLASALLDGAGSIGSFGPMPPQPDRGAAEEERAPRTRREADPQQRARRER